MVRRFYSGFGIGFSVRVPVRVWVRVPVRVRGSGGGTADDERGWWLASLSASCLRTNCRLLVLALAVRARAVAHLPDRLPGRGQQFIPLAGEHGLLPAARFVREVPFRLAPSIFYWFSDRPRVPRRRLAGRRALARRVHRDRAARRRACRRRSSGRRSTSSTCRSSTSARLLRVRLGIAARRGGFFTIFAGASFDAPPSLLNWIYRWTLFRLMFGAGLIKLRGDACWRDLTCLDYFFETQPMPNPLSWYFHHLPRSVLHGGVAFNHFVELIVPFGFFLPQPYRRHRRPLHDRVSAHADRRRQPVVAELADDRPRVHDARRPVPAWLPVSAPPLQPMPSAPAHRHRWRLPPSSPLLSIAPTLNMLSPQQVMNTSFNPLQIVNTYGAFGSVTRERYEIIVEGTDATTS